METLSVTSFDAERMIVVLDEAQLCRFHVVHLPTVERPLLKLALYEGQSMGFVEPDFQPHFTAVNGVWMGGGSFRNGACNERAAEVAIGLLKHEPFVAYLKSIFREAGLPCPTAMSIVPTKIQELADDETLAQLFVSGEVQASKPESIPHLIALGFDPVQSWRVSATVCCGRGFAKIRGNKTAIESYGGDLVHTAKVVAMRVVKGEARFTIALLRWVSDKKDETRTDLQRIEVTPKGVWELMVERKATGRR